MLRLPRRLLGRPVVDTYCQGESIRAKYKGDHIIVTFSSEHENAADIDEDDGDGWMSALSPLRAELASGDRRCLYLGWLASAQALDLDDDALEPPVPSGLGALSTAQQMLASFLRLGSDLVYVASEASQPLEPAVSRQSIEAWVRGLADSDKTKLLVRLVAADDPHHLHAELIQRVTQALEPAAAQVPVGTGARRTVEQLLGSAARRAEARTRAAVDAPRLQQHRERHAKKVSPLDRLDCCRNSRGRRFIHGPAVTPAHSLLQPATRGRVRQDALPETRTTAVARRDGASAHP
jgi:hypothetical protein